MQGQLFAVEVYLILRLVVLTADVDFAYSFHVQQLAFQFGSHLVGMLEVVSIYLEVGRSRTAHAALLSAHDDLCLVQFGVTLQVVAHLVADGFQRDVTLFGADEADVERDDVAAVVLHRGEGVVRVGLSHCIVAHTHDALVAFHPEGGQLAGESLCTFHAGSDGQLQLDADAAVVCRREELRTDELGTEEAQHEETGTSQHHHHAVAYRPVQAAFIPVVQRVQRMQDGRVQLQEELALLLLQAQELRTHHGGERKGRDGRDGHDDAHHPAQLMEQHTRHAADHGQWEEHGNHGEGRGDDGDGHLVGGMDGCLLGFRTALDVSGHVLQHHDGIVHHVTDGDGEAGERNDVQRTAVDDAQVDERGNQRHGDGDADDDGGTPATQEGEHHQHHKEHGVADGFRQAVDGVQDVIRGVDDDAQLDIGRQGLLQLRQHVDDLLRDGHRVGSRLLLDDDHGSLHAVAVGLLGAFLHRVDDGGYVAQVDRGSALCAHHDVLHLLRVVKLTLHTQRVGVVADVEGTSRRVSVLCPDDGTDGLDGEVVGIQLVGVAVDVDFALGGTGDGYRTHTRYAGQRVYDVVVQYLVEGRLALLGLHRKEQDGNHVGAELEDDGCVHLVGQHGADHVQLVAHVVGQHVDVVSVFKLQRDDGDVL